MKFFAALAIFVLSFLSVIFLMMKMAGAGMPQNPLDLERDQIEFVIKQGEQQIVKEEMVHLDEYAHFFQNPTQEKEEEASNEKDNSALDS